MTATTLHPRYRCRGDRTLHRIPEGYAVDMQDGTQGRVYRKGTGRLSNGRYVDRDYQTCHGKLVAPVNVTGKYRAGVACSKRCVSAIGDDCECECAGKNHGAG